MSRIGRELITVPAGVTVTVADGNVVTVKGPLGELTQTFAAQLTIAQDGDKLSVTRPNDEKENRALHGLTRTLLNNMVVGVTKGFEKKLEIVGVGLKAAVKGNVLDLALGKSHPILHPIPAGLTVTVADNTKVTVAGIDKQLVGQFAAEVRGYYPPEPYKGKGVHYVGEYIRRKEGKSVGK